PTNRPHPLHSYRQCSCQRLLQPLSGESSTEPEIRAVLIRSRCTLKTPRHQRRFHRGIRRTPHSLLVTVFVSVSLRYNALDGLTEGFCASPHCGNHWSERIATTGSENQTSIRNPSAIARS